jgi:hypothetical protein
VRVELDPLFGVVPTNADNLEIVGVLQRRFEEKSWATVRWSDERIKPSHSWKATGN